VHFEETTIATGFRGLPESASGGSGLRSLSATTALTRLERSADQREFQVLNFAVNPVFARMQDSPGFRALKKRIGLDQVGGAIGIPEAARKNLLPQLRQR
jgi:hypothetical protein